jgi:hypothetical protein
MGFPQDLGFSSSSPTNSRVGFCPFASITEMEARCENAILVPSGDQAGSLRSYALTDR